MGCFGGLFLFGLYGRECHHELQTRYSTSNRISSPCSRICTAHRPSPIEGRPKLKRYRDCAVCGMHSPLERGGLIIQTRIELASRQASARPNHQQFPRWDGFRGKSAVETPTAVHHIPSSCSSDARAEAEGSCRQNRQTDCIFVGLVLVSVRVMHSAGRTCPVGGMRQCPFQCSVLGAHRAPEPGPNTGQSSPPLAWVHHDAHRTRLGESGKNLPCYCCAAGVLRLENVYIINVSAEPTISTGSHSIFLFGQRRAKAGIVKPCGLQP